MIGASAATDQATMGVEVIGVGRTDDPGEVNDVVLRGRVSGDPQVRELPSGTVLVWFRVVMARGHTAMTASSKQPSDWVECTAWGSRVRNQVRAWRDGDQVEVRGALRRRFFRVAGQTRNSLEVEMLGGRRVRRSAARGRESVRAAAG